MNAHVYTKPDIGLAIGVLGQYQSNPNLEYRIIANKVLWYMQNTKTTA
jgi:hypothetical protein